MDKFKMKKIIFTLILFICLSFNIERVDAAGDGAGKSFGNATTCEYEMYQTHIAIDSSNNLSVIDNKIYGTTKIVYKGSSKKDYTISVTKKYEGDIKSADSFKDNGFAKKVTKSGCPKYIKYEKDPIGYSLDEVNETKFLSLADTGVYGFAYNYPLLLVKENGKSVAAPIDTFLSQETQYWIDYKATDGYNNLSEQEKNNVLSLEKKFISNVNSSSIYSSVVSKNDTWIKYLNGSKTDKKIKEKEEKLDSVKNNYCELYCTTQCKNATPASAQSACNSSCQSEQLPKCNAAVQACSNATSNEMDSCMKTQLESQGLNTQYTEERKTEIENMEKEIEELKSFKASQISNLNLKFGDGKIECKDVVELHKYWVAIQILAPILVILFGSIDLLISIVSADEEKIIKARKKFPRRLMAAFLLLLASFVVSLIVSISSNDGYSDDSLMKCIINGN